MHMADALVAPAVAATMYVCSGGAAGFSVKKCAWRATRKNPGDGSYGCIRLCGADD